jgi:hypothetical protein
MKGGLQPGEAPALPRWAVAVAGALCAIAAGYTLYRGAVATLEYFDGYQFLVTAKRLAGDRATATFNLVRPPLLAILDLPALWLAQRGAPANLGYTLGPHLTSALLSLLSALAVFYAYRAVLQAPLALVGVVLLVTGRLFVRYGSLTMADILSMGLGALAMGAHLRALQRPCWWRDLLVGVGIGLGAAAKYPLLLMGAVVVLAELLVACKRRRLPLRRVAGLAVTAAASAASFAVVMALAQGLGQGWSQVGKFPAAVVQAFTMATGMVQAVLGLVLLAKDREERDLPFFAWLVGLGGILIASVGHNEVRYLLPAIPALIYFAVRGVEWLLRRAPSPAIAGAGLVVLVVGCAWGGARQAWADADPAFRADTPRRAAQALVRQRRPGGHLAWIGSFSCIYPERRVPLPKDEFFDSFNFYGPSMIYFLGEPAAVTPAWLATHDRDAVVVPSPNCSGLALPDKPPPPWKVFGVSRRPLKPSGAGVYATAEGDLVISVGSGPRPCRVTQGLPDRPDRQRILMFSDPSPRQFGPLSVATGSEIGCNAPGLQGIELLDLTVETIPSR